MTVRGNAVLRSQVVSRSALNSRVQWTSHSYSFVADSSVTTLTFQDVSPTSDSIDSLPDNVRVTADIMRRYIHSHKVKTVGCSRAI